ncbi:metallophosphoesterase [Fulvimarina sp. MAC8]|uniref:metallophosphoesterase n=1 Tax=Fulvimarina sp. MAC8 TaxID=3162874 RepID=UPI0032ECB5D3
MVRLWILSDLHQEDARSRWSPSNVPEHDVVVLAGDIAGGPAEAVAYAERTFDQPVVLFAGNHEFVGHAVPTAITEGRIAAACSRNVISLEDDIAEVAGVRFVGACFWTDFALFGRPRNVVLNDIHLVESARRKNVAE